METETDTGMINTNIPEEMQMFWKMNVSIFRIVIF